MFDRARSTRPSTITTPRSRSILLPFPAYAARALARIRKKEYAKAKSDMEKITQIEFKKADAPVIELLGVVPGDIVGTGRAQWKKSHRRSDESVRTIALAGMGLHRYARRGYAEAGDFDDAVKYQKKALVMNKAR